MSVGGEINLEVPKNNEWKNEWKFFEYYCASDII